MTKLIKSEDEKIKKKLVNEKKIKKWENERMRKWHSANEQRMKI